MEIEKMATLERTDNKSNSAVNTFFDDAPAGPTLG